MTKEDNIRELKAARGVAKRQLTLLERFIEGWKETDIYVFEARFESLDSIREHFESAQTELERLDEMETEEPADGQLTDRKEFENRFIQAKARLQRFMKESPNVSAHFNPSHNSTVLEMVSDLPKIDLPEFNGEYSEYPTFIELFDTLVTITISQDN